MLSKESTLKLIILMRQIQCSFQINAVIGRIIVQLLINVVVSRIIIQMLQYYLTAFENDCHPLFSNACLICHSPHKDLSTRNCSVKTIHFMFHASFQVQRCSLLFKEHRISPQTLDSLSKPNEYHYTDWTNNCLDCEPHLGKTSILMNFLQNPNKFA